MQLIKTTNLLILTLALTLSFNSYNQNFNNKISNKASLVFTINGNNLIDKVSPQEINKSLIFAEILSEFRRYKNINKIEDFGLDYNKNFVSALETDTNMMYHILFMPLKSSKVFKNLINQMYGDVIKGKKYEMISKGIGGSALAWNKNQAVFISSTYMGSKFSYQYDEYGYYEINNAINKVLRDIHNSGKEVTIEEKAKRVNKILEERKQLKAVAKKTNTEELGEAEDEAVNVYDLKKEYYPTYQEKSEIRDFRREIQNKKNDLIREQQKEYEKNLVKIRLTQIFAKKGLTSSINSNKSFTKSKDNNADGVFWMKNSLGGMYGSGLSGLLYGRSFRRSMRGMRNYTPYGRLRAPFYNSTEIENGETIAKLYFEKDKIKISTNGFYGESMKKSFENMYNTSLDKKFYNYVNQDNFIGYYTMSLNTKGLMEEFPKIWTSAYATIMPKFKEEFNVMAEVLSVFLDEEAIGELVTGDLFFVVNDLKEKEVKYMTYEYDDNYNRTQVEKTKKELLPEFLFMLASKNEKLLEKIVKLGVKHEFLINNGSYYVVNSKKSDFPMNLYSTIKNGMVFITTNENEIKTILAGGYKNKLAKKHQDLINKNVSVVYYKNEKLMTKIPIENIKRKKEIEAFNYVKNNSKDVYMTVGSNKGDFTSNIIMNIPKGEKNGAMYLFNFFNKVLEIDKGGR